MAHLGVAAGDFGCVAADHGGFFGRERVVRAGGADQPLSEAVAAPCLRGVDGHRAQGFARHLPQLVAGVHAEGARVGDLHRHAFQFDRHGTLGCQGRSCRGAVRELLDRLGEGRGVRHGAVARRALGQQHLPEAVVRRGHEALRAPVLVAQGDFEVQDVLAVADEAECARLDDACMNRADVHLVQRAPLHPVEGVVVDGRGAVRAVARKAQRLGPRHALEAHAPAFGDFAFEGVQLGVQGRERRQGALGVVVHDERREQHLGRCVVEQQAEEPQVGLRLVGQGEVVGHVVAFVAQARGQVVVESGVGYDRNVVEGYGRSSVVGYAVDHDGQMVTMRSISARSASGCHRPSTRATPSGTRAVHARRCEAAGRCTASWLGW